MTDEIDGYDLEAVDDSSQSAISVVGNTIVKVVNEVTNEAVAIAFVFGTMYGILTGVDFGGWEEFVQTIVTMIVAYYFVKAVK